MLKKAKKKRSQSDWQGSERKFEAIEEKNI